MNSLRFLLVIAVALFVAAVGTPTRAQEEKPAEEEQSDQQAGEKTEKEKTEKEKTEKKEEQKKKKTTTAGADSAADERTRRIISRVVRDFKNTLEGQSASSIRRVIDDKTFYDYPRFEDELDRLFRSVGEMRVFVRRVNVQTNSDDRAVAVVEVELEFADRVDPSRRESRRARITFDFQRTPKGWKITEIKPREFFFLN